MARLAWKFLRASGKAQLGTVRASNVLAVKQHL